ALVFARTNAVPAADGRTVDMIGMPDQQAELRLFAADADTATVYVVAVDVAGNQSAPSSIDIEFPKPPPHNPLIDEATARRTLFASCASTSADVDVVAVVAMAA